MRHSEAITVEFERPITADEARFVFPEGAPGVKVVDDPAALPYAA